MYATAERIGNIGLSTSFAEEFAKRVYDQAFLDRDVGTLGEDDTAIISPGLLIDSMDKKDFTGWRYSELEKLYIITPRLEELLVSEVENADDINARANLVSSIVCNMVGEIYIELLCRQEGLSKQLDCEIILFSSSRKYLSNKVDFYTSGSRLDDGTEFSGRDAHQGEIAQIFANYVIKPSDGAEIRSWCARIDLLYCLALERALDKEFHEAIEIVSERLCGFSPDDIKVYQSLVIQGEDLTFDVTAFVGRIEKVFFARIGHIDEADIRTVRIALLRNASKEHNLQIPEDLRSKEI